MLTSCIITCFNYQDFVKDAVSSALAQTVAFDEIIVVDDASSDESPQIIAELRNSYPTLKLIRHSINKGQLAAFETGIIESKGELIFFLDADDVYAPNYLETSIDAYEQNNDCHFLFCEKVEFGRHLPESLFDNAQLTECRAVVTDLGYSLVRTYEEKVWIGAPTSCLSIRRRLAERLFPLPVHEDWRIRADDCIVFGASLAGYRKFRLDRPLIGYRVHGNNAWANNKQIEDPNKFFSRHVSIVRLFNLLSHRFYLDKKITNLAEFEFKTIPSPSVSDLIRYTKFVFKSGPRSTSRFRAIGVLFKWYFESRKLKRIRKQSQR